MQSSSLLVYNNSPLRCLRCPFQCGACSNTPQTLLLVQMVPTPLQAAMQVLGDSSAADQSQNAQSQLISEYATQSASSNVTLKFNE